MIIVIKIEVPEVEDVDGIEADNILAIVQDTVGVPYVWYIDDVYR